MFSQLIPLMLYSVRLLQYISSIFLCCDAARPSVLALSNGSY